MNPSASRARTPPCTLVPFPEDGFSHRYDIGEQVHWAPLLGFELSCVKSIRSGKRDFGLAPNAILLLFTGLGVIYFVVCSVALGDSSSQRLSGGRDSPSCCCRCCVPLVKLPRRNNQVLGNTSRYWLFLCGHGWFVFRRGVEGTLNFIADSNVYRFYRAQPVEVQKSRKEAYLRHGRPYFKKVGAISLMC